MRKRVASDDGHRRGTVGCRHAAEARPRDDDGLDVFGFRSGIRYLRIALRINQRTTRKRQHNRRRAQQETLHLTYPLA